MNTTKEELEMILKWAKVAKFDLRHDAGPARTNVSMIVEQLKEIIERE